MAHFQGVDIREFSVVYVWLSYTIHGRVYLPTWIVDLLVPKFASISHGIHVLRTNLFDFYAINVSINIDHSHGWVPLDPNNP